MTAEPAFDFRAALQQADGDAGLLAVLADLFTTQAALDTASMREAVTRGDHAEMARRAHRLKGSAMQLHAAPLRSAAERLEDLARREALDEAAALVPLIEQAVEDLAQAMRKALEHP